MVQSLDCAGPVCAGALLLNVMKKGSQIELPAKPCLRSVFPQDAKGLSEKKDLVARGAVS